MPRSQDCPRLESRLYELSQSAAPEQFAAGAGLDLSSAGVRVVIELVPDADLPRGYATEVEARYANTLQARLPLTTLCALAQEQVVISIASAPRGVPGAGP
jgi:hypothetical protein